MINLPKLVLEVKGLEYDFTEMQTRDDYNSESPIVKQLKDKYDQLVSQLISVLETYKRKF